MSTFMNRTQHWWQQLRETVQADRPADAERSQLQKLAHRAWLLLTGVAKLAVSAVVAAVMAVVQVTAAVAAVVLAPFALIVPLVLFAGLIYVVSWIL